MAAEFSRMPFFYNADGRLVQVDYALQAVGRGSTTIGLKTKDFVLLSSHVKPTRPLLEPAEKVYIVDDHIGATGSGYIGDVSTLVDEVRVEAQRHRLTYDTPADVGTLTRHLGKFLHQYTLYAVRPFGASVLIGGVDNLGLQLTQVDPSGTTFRGSGFVIGAGAEEALEVIHKGYRPDLTVDAAKQLISEAIGATNGEAKAIEHGLVTRNPPRFRKLNGEA